jgi:hypothetical protein
MVLFGSLEETIKTENFTSNLQENLSKSDLISWKRYDPYKIWQTIAKGFIWHTKTYLIMFLWKQIFRIFRFGGVYVFFSDINWNWYKYNTCAYIYYIRLKIKPNSVRIRFLELSNFCSSLDGIWTHTIVIYASWHTGRQRRVKQCKMTFNHWDGSQKRGTDWFCFKFVKFRLYLTMHRTLAFSIYFC